MPLLRYLLGRPLSSREDISQRVGVWEGVAIFGLDALGSAAYGPEAALTILIPAGLVGLRYILPVTAVITALLLMVYFSYQQTIGAYPNGGGAYTVASENLGQRMGMLAGASLMLDYLLNVSVGISTGIGALTSAIPHLEPYTLSLCLGVLVLLFTVNLRGTRESGALWVAPTYLFTFCLLVVIAEGCARTVMAKGAPVPRTVLPHGSTGTAVIAAGPWILIRSFASGCTALTGVEAVSNGVRSFKEPKDRTARRTLRFIVIVLSIFLMGIAFLVKAYGVTATAPAQPGYESVLSMLTAAVMGRGIFYYLTIGAILMVLSLSANTSFAGFPQLCRTMAEDGYLPRSFTLRGRRLAYTTGIVVLGVLSGSILVVFGGITDRLIPLFAIGAFMAFTLSQAGMVGHWRKSADRHARLYAWVNGVGAVATGTTVLVVFIAKFMSGAWLTLVLLALALTMLTGFRRHHDRVENITHIERLRLDPLPRLPMMLLPISRWNRATMAALQFACSLSDDVRVLHITDIAEEGEQRCRQWQEELNEAAQQSGTIAPRVIAICSPYRKLTDPLMNYVTSVEHESPGRKIAVVIAEVVADRWYEHVMHNYPAMLLRWRLFLEGNRRVVIVDMPWQIPSS